MLERSRASCERLWRLDFILWLERKRVKISCVYIGTGVSKPWLAGHPSRFGTVSKLRMVFTFKRVQKRGAWVAQSAEHPTPGFGSGQDLTAHEIDPHAWLCSDCTEPAEASLLLSLPLSCSPELSLSLSLFSVSPASKCTHSLKINKKIIKNEWTHQDPYIY